MKTINSIVLTIVTFLLTIFPWSASLEAKYQQLTYPGEMVVTENIIEAVKNKDAKAIENMLSYSTKKSSDGLLEQIEKLFNTIEGDIVDAGWYCGGHDSVKKDYASVESSTSWGIMFETTEDNYLLHVCWVRIDTIKPENVGMTGITLFDMDRNILTEVY